jgi:hypothetical protein
MKTWKPSVLFLILLLVTASAFSQQEEYHIKTLFNTSSKRSSGGYGAIGNKFTMINGQYANLVEVYGGWYINHHFLLGVGAAAATNNIPVPAQFSSVPGINMSYEYGQFGLMTEYVIGNDRAIHFAFQLFNGAGFTVQYQRHHWENGEDWDNRYDNHSDDNWFFVTEPGVKVEMNILKWMRFCPGISYRAAFGSSANGLSDSNISGASMNLTLKFGKF